MTKATSMSGLTRLAVIFATGTAVMAATGTAHAHGGGNHQSDNQHNGAGQNLVSAKPSTKPVASSRKAKSDRYGVSSKDPAGKTRPALPTASKEGEKPVTPGAATPTKPPAEQASNLAMPGKTPGEQASSAATPAKTPGEPASSAATPAKTPGVQASGAAAPIANPSSGVTNVIHPILSPPPTTVTISNGVTTYKIPDGAGGVSVSSNSPGTITVTNGNESRTLSGGSLTVSGAIGIGGGTNVQVGTRNSEGSTVVAIAPPAPAAGNNPPAQGSPASNGGHAGSFSDPLHNAGVGAKVDGAVAVATSLPTIATAATIGAGKGIYDLGRKTYDYISSIWN